MWSKNGNFRDFNKEAEVRNRGKKDVSRQDIIILLALQKEKPNLVKILLASPQYGHEEFQFSADFQCIYCGMHSLLEEIVAHVCDEKSLPNRGIIPEEMSGQSKSTKLIL